MYPTKHQRNVYVEEDDLGPYADDTAKLVPLDETPDPQHLTLTQRLQMQIQKCERYIKSLYVDTQKTKKHFRSMKKEMHKMKKQLSNIESYIYNIEKDKNICSGGAATSNLSVSLIPLPDGVPLRRRTQPRLVTVKRDPQDSAPVTSSSK